MSVSEILGAIAAGGPVMMLFVIGYFQWRDLVRCREDYDKRIASMHEVQNDHVRKIAKLEARLEYMARATEGFRSSPPALRQPTPKPPKVGD